MSAGSKPSLFRSAQNSGGMDASISAWLLRTSAGARPPGITVDITCSRTDRPGAGNRYINQNQSVMSVSRCGMYEYSTIGSFDSHFSSTLVRTVCKIVQQVGT